MQHLKHPTHNLCTVHTVHQEHTVHHCTPLYTTVHCEQLQTLQTMCTVLAWLLAACLSPQRVGGGRGRPQKQAVRNSTVVYCTLCSVVYYTILSSTVFQCYGLNCTARYCYALYSSILQFRVLQSIVQLRHWESDSSENSTGQTIGSRSFLMELNHQGKIHSYEIHHFKGKPYHRRSQIWGKRHYQSQHTHVCCHKGLTWYICSPYPP